jgi:membrane associated rhomboid family serine protease
VGKNHEFDPTKDERLNRIAADAGAFAFIFYFFFAMALMIAQGFIDWAVLSDPSFLLVVPWLLSALVFIAFHIKGGYYTTVREESTRTPERLQSARIEALLTGLIAGAFYFIELRLDIFTDKEATIGEDLLDAAIFGFVLAAASWFVKARKRRKRREEEV